MHQYIVKNVGIFGLKHSNNTLDEVQVQVAQTAASHIHKKGNLFHFAVTLKSFNPENKNTQEILLFPALRVLVNGEDQQGVSVFVLVVDIDRTIVEVFLV